jgi:hypothetical protein
MIRGYPILGNSHMLPLVFDCFWGIKSLNKSDVIKKGLHPHYLPEIVHGWKCHEDSMLKRQCIYKSGRFQPAIGNSGRSHHTPDENALQQSIVCTTFDYVTTSNLVT